MTTSSTDCTSSLIGGRLPVALAADGAPPRPGGITLARPDWHLLVDDGRLRLTQSREEHHFRPAIDPLFRTAARAYGPRVVGVLLSGRNADGTTGLLNVVLHGGVAIVQDPAEAEHPAMPLSALANIPGARCLRLAAIAAALVELTAATRRPDERRGQEHPLAIHQEVILRACLGPIGGIGAGVLAPALGADAGAVQAGATPVDRVQIAQPVQDHLMQLPPDPVCLPLAQAASSTAVPHSWPATLTCYSR